MLIQVFHVSKVQCKSEVQTKKMIKHEANTHKVPILINIQSVIHTSTRYAILWHDMIHPEWQIIILVKSKHCHKFCYKLFIRRFHNP